MMDFDVFYQLFLKSTGASTDTRTIQKNNIFFALKGETFDGNTHASKAIEAGAMYAVIDDQQYENEQTILVSNVLEFLQQFSKYYRQQLNIPIIALTGSNGKTTTKELLYAVLSQKYKTTGTKGNLNNHIGVPLTLLSIQQDDEMAIVEMGANHQEEISFLCSIAQPDYGLVNNIGKAHLEGFGGIEGVKKGKGEMYDYLFENKKTIFVNGDDSVLLDVLKQKNITDFIKYGTHEDCKYQAKLNREKFTITIDYKENKIASPMYGYYNFPNFMAAIALGNYFSVSDAQIVKGLESYVPSNNRSQTTTWHKNTLIMDSYNANPSSMMSAIENFYLLNTKNKMVILGDMFELGNESQLEHVNILKHLQQNPFDQNVFVGKDFLFAKNNFPQAKYFLNTQELKEYLSQNEIEDHTILVKGSRGIGLEKAFL